MGNWQLTQGISCAIVRRKNGADAFLVSARRSGGSAETPRVLSGASIVTRASMCSLANRSISESSPTSSSGAVRAQGSSVGHIE